MTRALVLWTVPCLFLLAGCFSEDNEDTFDTSVKLGEMWYATHEFESAADLTLELEAATGQFNVYVVNETDLEKVRTNKPFYSHASWRNATTLDETIRLGPGEYAVTLLCGGQVEACEFKITLRTT